MTKLCHSTREAMRPSDGFQNNVSGRIMEHGKSLVGQVEAPRAANQVGVIADYKLRPSSVMMQKYIDSYSPLNHSCNVPITFKSP
jgi:hypothetical protein